MFHENIRIARHHRGLVARAVTIDSEPPPTPTTTTTTTAGEEKGKGKEKQEEDPPTDPTDARPGPTAVHKPDASQPDDPTSTPISATTLSIVQPVVPTASDTVVAGPVPTTTSVLPATTTSSVATSSTFSSKSASVKLSTVTTVVKASSTSSTSHAAISAKASASSTPVATGAVSGGAIAGGVVGGLAGLALLVAVVFVVVRHYRRKSLDTLVFNASKFRHSALLLDDPPTPKEKLQGQRGPRPPSMISRHLNAPAVPQASAASPYSEHAAQSADPYGHYATTAAQYSVGMYGADGQITRDPYADVYGANATSDRNVSHGQPASGAPPMQFRFPQQPYQQQRGYQSSFAPGAHASATAVNVPLLNPISSAPSSTSASAALAAAYAAAQVKSASSDRSHSHPTSGPNSNHEVLIRRPSSQPNNDPPTYENDPKYANIQRDVKVAPGTLAAVNNENNALPPSVARTTSNTRRPMSSYTVYDPEDAYGGM